MMCSSEPMASATRGVKVEKDSSQRRASQERCKDPILQIGSRDHTVLLFWSRSSSPIVYSITLKYAMALTSTIYNFDVELADSDRGVYETLPIRAALHPSETEEYLWTRVLAYCLSTSRTSPSRRGSRTATSPPSGCATRPAASRPGSRSAPRTPRASTRPPRRRTGSPSTPTRTRTPCSAASKASASTAARRSPSTRVDRQLLADLVALLDRRMKLHLSVTGGSLYVDVAGKSLSGVVTEHRIG